MRALLAAAGTPGVERAAASDALALGSHFRAADVSGLWAERNVLRYLPVPVSVRLAADGSLADLVRVLAAGLAAGAPLRVSVASPLPSELAAALPAPLTVEDDATWAAGLSAGRVRLIGTSAALPSTPDLAVWSGPVTEAGRVELLPFLHEQAISITAHRFGNPDRLAAEVL